MLERLHKAADSSSRRTNIHVLPKAGHWLHFDNAEGLLTMMDGFIHSMKDKHK